MKWRHTAATRLGKEPESDLWNTLRYCVPLNRLTVCAVGDYHGFATLVSLRVALDTPHREIFPVNNTISDNMRRLYLEKDAPDDATSFNFNLAVITDQERFVHQLSDALAVARGRHLKPDAPTPTMSLSIAGIDLLQDEVEQTPNEVEPAESLPAKIARKAERSHLAAKVFGLHEEEGMWRKSASVLADRSEKMLHGH
jgi:sterol 3beta-glucosyltransferase